MNISDVTSNITTDEIHKNFTLTVSFVIISDCIRIFGEQSVIDLIGKEFLDKYKKEFK